MLLSKGANGEFTKQNFENKFEKFHFVSFTGLNKPKVKDLGSLRADKHTQALKN